MKRINSNLTAFVKTSNCQIASIVCKKAKILCSLLHNFNTKDSMIYRFAPAEHIFYSPEIIHIHANKLST